MHYLLMPGKIMLLLLKKMDKLTKNKYEKFAGEMLRMLREQRKLTQVEVAELLGVSHTTISKIERGEWNFTVNFLFAYIEKLGFFLFIQDKEANTTLAENMRNRWFKDHSDN